MSDVIISTHEGRVFHEEFCPYIGRIKKRYRKQIPEERAIERGYCECKFCRSVRGLVYKYRKLGKENVYYDKGDNAFCIMTPGGFWKLLWRENKQEWHLFHMNHKGWKHFDPNLSPDILMRGSFHRQEDFRATTKLSKAIKYVESHDKNYLIAESDIRKMPKATSQQRKNYKKQKKRKHREDVRNVYRIFRNIEKEKK